MNVSIGRMNKKIIRKNSTLSTYLKNEKKDRLKTVKGGVPINQSMPINTAIMAVSVIK
jgi:hypothetical protein